MIPKSVDDLLDTTLNFLRRYLNFTPSVFELRELREHAEAVLPLYISEVKRGKSDAYSISAPCKEVVARFFFFSYEMKVDFTEPELGDSYSEYTLKLVAELKQKQADMHHP